MADKREFLNRDPIRFLSGVGGKLQRLLSLAVGLWHKGWMCHMGLLSWALF